MQVFHCVEHFGHELVILLFFVALEDGVEEGLLHHRHCLKFLLNHLCNHHRTCCFPYSEVSLEDLSIDVCSSVLKRGKRLPDSREHMHPRFPASEELLLVSFQISVESFVQKKTAILNFELLDLLALVHDAAIVI